MAQNRRHSNTNEELWGAALILLGAVSGAASLAILTGFWEEDPILSPILGVISILLLAAGGLTGKSSF